MNITLAIISFGMSQRQICLLFANLIEPYFADHLNHVWSFKSRLALRRVSHYKANMDLIPAEKHPCIDILFEYTSVSCHFRCRKSVMLTKHMFPLYVTIKISR